MARNRRGSRGCILPGKGAEKSSRVGVKGMCVCLGSIQLGEWIREELLQSMRRKYPSQGKREGR